MAFYGTSITTVDSRNVTPPTVGGEAFPATLAKVTVPAEVVDNYLADDYWSKYIDEESGIRQTISGNSDEPTEIFCLDGRCQAAPFKGVHILRQSNGKTMKTIR